MAPSGSLRPHSWHGTVLDLGKCSKETSQELNKLILKAQNDGLYNIAYINLSPVPAVNLSPAQLGTPPMTSQVLCPHCCPSGYSGLLSLPSGSLTMRLCLGRQQKPAASLPLARCCPIVWVSAVVSSPWACLQRVHSIYAVSSLYCFLNTHPQFLIAYLLTERLLRHIRRCPVTSTQLELCTRTW